MFYDEFYFVTPGVLIPRPDTERVVDHALKFLPEGGRLLDLCCGSGCIAISSLRHSANTSALLVDVSPPALDLARRNAERNGVLPRCGFLCADLRGYPQTDGQFDVIASNPPYVRSAVVDTLEKECSYEPRIAFDGGEDGMDFYRILLEICPPNLKKGGRMIFEIGFDQREAITALCRERNYFLQVFRDDGKNDRVAVIDPFTAFAGISRI